MLVVEINKSWSAGKSQGYIVMPFVDFEESKYNKKTGDYDDDDGEIEYGVRDWAENKCSGGLNNGYNVEYHVVVDKEILNREVKKYKERLLDKKVQLECELEQVNLFLK